MSPFVSPHPRVSVSEESFFTWVLRRDDALNPASPAAIDGTTGEVVTRGNLRSRYLNLASALKNLGAVGLLPLSRGSVVTVFSPNSTLYPMTVMALGAAGMVGAFANPSWTDAELANALRTSKSTHILSHPAVLPTVVKALASLDISEEEAKRRIILLSARTTVPAQILSAGWLIVDDLVPEPVSTIPEKFDGARSEETALVFFSSGTTGPNKAVALSHRNVVAILTQVVATWDHFQPEKDVLLAVIPFFHVFGAIAVLLFSYVKGVPFVILPRFDPVSFLSSIPKYKITTLMLVPPLLKFIAMHPAVEKFDITTIRSIVVGAAPVAPRLFSDCLARFEARGCTVVITHAFGLTESSGAVSHAPLPIEEEKRRSVGPLLPNMEGRVVGEDGVDVELGLPGELWVRGPNIMKGYIGDDAANAAAFTADGWFKTGDVVTCDADGNLTVVDRSKELIKYKGFQVPPAELEALLITHPAIADAGVTGVYSEAEATELPKAFIVLKDQTAGKDGKQGDFIQDVHNWLQDRVAHYKLLRGGIVLVDTIPRSAAGKILRRHLKTLVVST